MTSYISLNVVSSQLPNNRKPSFFSGVPPVELTSNWRSGWAAQADGQVIAIIFSNLHAPKEW